MHHMTVITRRRLLTGTAALLAASGLPARVFAAQKPLSVVTTIFPAYDFVREIGGDRVQATLLLKPGQESHTFDPTPADIKRIRNADLFIYTGGENDVWVDEMLSSFGDKAPQTLRLVDMVNTVDEEHVEGMQDDDEHDHHHHHDDDHDEHDHDDHDHDHDEHDEADGSESEAAELDEHVWTSPENAQEIVKGLTAVLIELAPENRSYFEKRAAAYDQKLDALDEAFEAVVEHAKHHTLVFGDRFPFRYFTDLYGLDYYAAFPGCSAQTRASAATVAFLSKKVKELKLPVVLTLEGSSGKLAHSIAEHAGARVLQLHSCHNLSTQEYRSGETYLSLMRQNVDILKQALN